MFFFTLSQELKAHEKYDRLPVWTPDQPAQAQGLYRGMRTVMRTLHLDRCRLVNFAKPFELNILEYGVFTRIYSYYLILHGFR